MPRQTLLLTSQDLFQDLVECCCAQHSAWELGAGVLSLGALRLMEYDFADVVSGRIFGGPVGVIEGDETVVAWFDIQYDRLRHCAEHGLRTLWYNPELIFAPDPLPLHDGAVASFAELARVPALLAKPTLSTCFQWLDEWRLPENIRRHASLVGWMAYVLGVLLQREGVALDPILAHRGGLLHDLDKLHTLDPTQKHGDMGANFMAEQGYPDLAAIIAGHVMRGSIEVGDQPPTWEARLVFFCDKLAEEDRIVPFNARLDALLARYPAFEGVMRQAEPYVWELSDQICSILSIPNHQNLINLLKKLKNN